MLLDTDPTTGTTTALVSRVLPFAEWPRLANTELDLLATWGPDKPPPPDITVLVVERDGKIIACWASVITVHVEGLWFAPDARRRAAVARALFQAMTDHLAGLNVAQVMTNSLSPEVDTMIEGAGGQRVPGQLWTLPVHAWQTAFQKE